MNRIALFGVFVSAMLNVSVRALDSNSLCFYPDGITTDSNHKPCNTTIGTSACCDPKDSCTTSGLCLGRTGFNYRGSCTDRTWGSANCPSQCHSDPFNDEEYADFTPLWPCDKPGAPSFKYCCSSPTRNCCTIATFDYGNTGFAFKHGFDAVLALAAEASTSSASTTQTASLEQTTVTITETTTTTATAVAAAAASQSSKSMDIGSTIGTAIGVPLGVIAVGLISFLFWRERRIHKAEEGMIRMRTAEAENKPAPWPKDGNMSQVYTGNQPGHNPNGSGRPYDPAATPSSGYSLYPSYGSKSSATTATELHG